MDDSNPEWLDPRPQQTSSSPAPRGSSSNRRLVLFDNGKLSSPYDWRAPAVPALLQILEAMGEVVQERRELLGEHLSAHGALIEDWKRRKIDGIVFGLCDAGVVQPNLLLAAAAEKAGIPTAVLCTSNILELAAVSASFLVAGLPLIELRDSRTAKPEQVRSAVAEISDEIRSALLNEPSRLKKAFETRFPFTADMARSSNGRPGADFADVARRGRMTDGFPVVPPQRATVERAIAGAGRQPDDVIIEAMMPSATPLTVRQAAICAIMAGCSAEHFPFVLAALEAMAAPQYRFHLATITTHPGGNLALFSGKAAIKAGIVSGRGCLGPGHQANATIGRSIALTIINVGRAIPGLSTLSLMGSPAQYSYCFADAPDGPFAPLHNELAGADDTIVLVLKCDSPHNVIDTISRTPRSLLGSFASVAATTGGNNAYLPSDLIVVLNPDHAALIAEAGWTRADIQQYLWETARNERSRLRDRGTKRNWPPEWNDLDPVPVVPGPDNIWVVVAGAAGPHSQVIVPWGHGSAVWRRVNV